MKRTLHIKILLIFTFIFAGLNASDKDRTPNYNPPQGTSTTGSAGYARQGGGNYYAGQGEIRHRRGDNIYRAGGYGSNTGGNGFSINFTRKFRALVREILLEEIEGIGSLVD